MAFSCRTCLDIRRRTVPICPVLVGSIGLLRQAVLGTYVRTSVRQALRLLFYSRHVWHGRTPRRRPIRRVLRLSIVAIRYFVCMGNQYKRTAAVCCNPFRPPILNIVRGLCPYRLTGIRGVAMEMVRLSCVGIRLTKCQ